MEDGRTERDALLRRQIRVMDPDRFEVMVSQLAQREEPTARRLIAPDDGADTLRPATSARSAKVWQAKRYPDQINWQECEESLDRAAERWTPEGIVFVFARDFSATVQKSFQEKLVERDTAQGIRIEAWTLTDVVERLDANSDIKIRFFGEEQRSLEEGVAR